MDDDTLGQRYNTSLCYMCGWVVTLSGCIVVVVDVKRVLCAGNFGKNPSPRRVTPSPLFLWPIYRLLLLLLLAPCYYCHRRRRRCCCCNQVLFTNPSPHPAHQRSALYSYADSAAIRTLFFTFSPLHHTALFAS